MEVVVEGSNSVGVHYRCSCGISTALARLYWCRHCIGKAQSVGSVGLSLSWLELS